MSIFQDFGETYRVAPYKALFPEQCLKSSLSKFLFPNPELAEHPLRTSKFLLVLVSNLISGLLISGKPLLPNFFY